MDPKLISGLHVAVDFDLSADAGGLGEALNMVRKLEEHIRACPEVRNLHIGQMVELNGVFLGCTEERTKGVLYKLTENAEEDADG